MKYQNFAIIFILITVPISIVLSYYIQTQTDTLALETIYQTKLNDSTYDAVTSYQMNSLNTQKISGESVKSYVLASVNTFFTTLATNMGMSSSTRSMLQNYVPAILFTTYDGYYIYSPTKTNMLATYPGGLPSTDEHSEDAGQSILTRDQRFIYLRSGYERVAYKTQTEIDNAGTKEVSYEELKKWINGTTDRVPAGVTLNPTENDVDYNYLLKPFIYYSANYRKSDGTDQYNIIASYTLDNYLTVYGKKNKDERPDSGILEDYEYTDQFTKSGYLIDPAKIEIKGSFLIEMAAKDPYDTAPDAYKRSRQRSPEADKRDFRGLAALNAKQNPNENGKNNTRYLVVNIDTTRADSYKEIYYYINYYDRGIIQTFSYNEPVTYGGRTYMLHETYSPNEVTDKGKEPRRKRTGDEIIEDTLEIQFYGLGADEIEHITRKLDPGKPYENLTVKYNGIDITDKDAMEYYIKAFFFSKWVQNNLSSITADTINLDEISADEKNQFAYLTKFGNEQIFAIGGEENDPEDEGSLITQHKRDVVKNSIQFNLNTAISTYNTNHGVNLTNNEDDYIWAAYELPQLTEYDWDSILNNICMVSFMQGMPCGTTIFNDYAVVKSNNNNTSASIDNLYFTKEINEGDHRTNNGYYYHKIDCPDLAKDIDDPLNPLPDGWYYEADLAAEFKYDAIKLKSKVETINDVTSETEKIVCFYDEEHIKYYRVEFLENGDTDRSAYNIDNLGVGTEIVGGETYEPDGPGGASYTKDDLIDLPNGTKNKYMYDHQNEGCYNCMIGSNYTPAVKFYKGKLYATYESETGELLMYEDIPGRIDGGTWRYADDGALYDGSRLGQDSKVNQSFTTEGNIRELIINDKKLIDIDGTTSDLYKRRKALYTYIAKIRNNLYKTNSYINI